MIVAKTAASITTRAAVTPVAWNTVARRLASSEVIASEQQIVPVDTVSGAPEVLTTERTVRIFSPAKTATQSGKNGSRQWRIDFDILDEGNRWENPLMGWASSADYMQPLVVKFSTREEAIRFAEKQGWNYYVQEPKTAKFVKKSYADNYKYSAGKLRMIKTK